MKIGVVIPCQKSHIGLLQQCLNSIESQIKKPDYVVVSISGCDQNDIPQMEHYSFTLKVLQFRKEYSLAENRNIGAALCKYECCTHISFFDAESIMHPQRIQIITKCIETKPNLHILLHSYANYTEELIPYSGINALTNKLRKAKSGCAVVEGNTEARIHHSHCTVQTNIWNQVKFCEEKEYEGKDNAVFCGDVLAPVDIQSIYVEEKLSRICVL